LASALRTAARGEQFKLRLLTAQRGGEVLHLLWSALDLDGGLWTKAFQFRKRKPTDTHQPPHLVPLAPMAVTILRNLKDYHERELARKNATYGGTWNGKKYGGWPREQISDWVFPGRTNPAHAMASYSSSWRENSHNSQPRRSFTNRR
jgi:integrase